MIESYKDMTLKVMKGLLETEEMELNPLERQLEILSILSGMDVEDIASLPLDRYREMVRKSQFLNTELKPERIKDNSITINNNRYVITLNPKKMKAAQFIDWQNWQRETKGSTEGLPCLLSCIIVPEGKQYNEGYELEDVQNDIREHMNVQDMVSLSFFFLRIWTRWLRGMKTFLKPEKRTLRKRMRMKGNSDSLRNRS